MSTSERQRLLQEQYSFLCQCQACSLPPGPLGQEQPSGLQCEKCKGQFEVGDHCHEMNGKFLFFPPFVAESTVFRVVFPDKPRGCWDQVQVCAGVLRSQRVVLRSEWASAGHQRWPGEGREAAGAREAWWLWSHQHGCVPIAPPCWWTALSLPPCPPSDEALRLLRRTQRESGAVLAETHPLQGELADATARAYATLGEHAANAWRRSGHPNHACLSLQNWLYLLLRGSLLQESFRAITMICSPAYTFPSNVRAGDWKNASSHLERSALATASQYGEDSVELGHQLFKLAQLHFNGWDRHTECRKMPFAMMDAVIRFSWSDLNCHGLKK